VFTYLGRGCEVGEGVRARLDNCAAFVEVLLLCGGECIVADVEVNHFLATALRRLNRVDEAEQFDKYKAELEKDLKRIQQLSKEIIEQPRNVSLRYEAGVIQQRLGQDQQAARWLISALLVDPTHEPTRQALAECLPKLGDTRLTEYYRQLLKQSSHGRPPADRIP
jgi:thioredoxin-like negative regulator of GroEL